MATNNAINNNIGVATGTSLNLGGSTLINGVINDNTMATASTTTAATSASIKAYVDAQVVSAGGSYQYISTFTASATSIVPFTNLSSTYYRYKILFSQVAPSVDNAGIRIRTSTNNGSSYDSGASDYDYNGATASSYLALTSVGVGNAANGYTWGEITIVNPSAVVQAEIYSTIGYVSPSATMGVVTNAGRRNSVAAVNAVGFSFTSGTVLSGIFKLYGIKPS